MDLHSGDHALGSVGFTILDPKNPLRNLMFMHYVGIPDTRQVKDWKTAESGLNKDKVTGDEHPDFSGLNQCGDPFIQDPG